MPGGTHIRNETGLRRNQAATETYPGLAATPDYRWLGMLDINESAALVRTPENTGTYDGLVTPRRELSTFSGTYSEMLTYQSFAQHNQYAIKAGATGVVEDSGYLYAVSPNPTDDDIATATVEYGVDGQVWRSTGVSHNEYTITIDTDDADGVWKMNSNLFVRDKEQVIGDEGISSAGSGTTLTDATKTWDVNEWAGAWAFLDFGTGVGQVRQVTSNTATVLTFYGPVLSPAPGAGVAYRIEGLFTAGIAFPGYDSIVIPGTQLYIDPADETIGTTQITDRFISYNITVNNMRTSKRFAENVNSLSARTGRGKRLITGQVRLEFDRRDEYQQYRDMSEVAIRVQQQGPALSGSAGDEMEATIDVARAVWDVFDEDERENNITATFGFVAYLPSAGQIATFSSVNDLATLP